MNKSSGAAIGMASQVRVLTPTDPTIDFVRPIKRSPSPGAQALAVHSTGAATYRVVKSLVLSNPSAGAKRCQTPIGPMGPLYACLVRMRDAAESLSGASPLT